MATLTELQTLLSDPVLRDKCRSACVKTAVSVAYEDAGTANHAARLVWAKGALNDPNGTADKVVRYLVAAMASSTLAEIQAASDATIQGHVDASLAVFAV